MDLLDELGKAYLEGENFAYFVTFDDQTRRSGKVTLFKGGYVTEDNGSDHFLCSECSENESCPVMVPFDYVSRVYPDIEFRRSIWPEIMALHSESVLHGAYARSSNSARVPGVKLNLVQDAMQQKISYAREKIISGELLQVVLSVEMPAGKVSTMELLKSLLATDTSLYVYYFRFGRFELLGSSPERLITVEGKRALVNPIAGTRGRDPDPQKDQDFENELISDVKEQCEHRMLVDLARNDLARISEPDTVRVEENMKVKKFRTVQHLVSTVTGTIADGVCNDQILKAVFPAGTVSGAPKKRALQLIGKLEDTPRGAYSGAVGLAGRNGMDLALVIRSLYGTDGDLKLRAGAGIVKDSVPEKETEEIRNKMAAVVQA